MPTEPAPVLADDVILAAVQRATCQQATKAPGVPFWAILDHLGLPPRSPIERRLRGRLRRLEDDGALARTLWHGTPIWELTRTGRSGTRATAPEAWAGLPESPQHRRWRHAHVLAGQELDRMRERLRRTVLEALAMLDATIEPSPDAWFLLSDRLRRDAWCVASAAHCLYEWPEPTEDRPDLDDHNSPGDEALGEAERARRRVLRAGRRNVKLWSSEITDG